MSFAEIEGAFDPAAKVVGSGRHLQIGDDGIEAVNDGFGKAQNDGASVDRRPVLPPAPIQGKARRDGRARIQLTSTAE